MFINIYTVNGAHSTRCVETYTFVYYIEAVNELIRVKLDRMWHVQSCVFSENMNLISVKKIWI